MPTPPLCKPSAPAALVLVLMLSAAGCKEKAAAGQGSDRPAMPVPIVEAKPTSVDVTSEYLSTLKSRNSNTISPQVDGQITHIYVKSGDKVEAGTPLLQIDPLKQQATAGSQEAGRAAKQASLRYAEEQLRRNRGLFAAGVASKQSLDESQANYDAAHAELNAIDAQVQEQNVQLRYYRVVAPTNGIVGDIPVHVGDRVDPSTVLTTVSQAGALEAYINVPVERARDLTLGKQVQILGGSGSSIAESRITFIAPQVNDVTQTILVKATVENNSGALRNEQLVRARIVWGSKPAILIPILAISRVNGQSFAFIAEPGEKSLVARQRQLRLGEMMGNDYVVLEGIKPGEKIITGSTQMLGDGAPVKPQT